MYLILTLKYHFQQVEAPSRLIMPTLPFSTDFVNFTFRTDGGGWGGKEKTEKEILLIPTLYISHIHLVTRLTCPNHRCLLRNTNVAKAAWPPPLLPASAPGPEAAACTSTVTDRLSSDLKKHPKIWLTKKVTKHDQKQGSVIKWMYSYYVLRGLVLMSLINRNENKIISDWSIGWTGVGIYTIPLLSYRG